MKKLPASIALACMLFTLTSCSGGNNAPDIRVADESDARVYFGDLACDCHISYVNGSTASVTILSPESIQGMKFTRSDNKSSASLGGMLCRRETPMTTESALDTRLFGMLDALSQADYELKKEQNGVFSFTAANGERSVSGKADSQGHLLLLEEEGLCIKFEEHK